MRALLLFFTLFSSAFALQAATPKDTLVVAVPLDGIISFDPAESFETVSNSVQRNIYQTLVEADRDAPQKLAPLLATSWQPGSTPHSLVFNLKPDAHFVSGNPVTAQDVVFSLTRAVQLNKAPSFILAEFGWTADNIASQLRVVNDQVGSPTSTIQPRSRSASARRAGEPGLAPSSSRARVMRPLVALLKWETTFRFPSTSCSTRTVATRGASSGPGRQKAA